MSMEQYIHLAGQDTHISIGIAYRKNGNLAPLVAGEMTSVADCGPLINQFNMGCTAPERHNRAEIKSFQRYIRAWCTAVLNDARTDHIQMVLRHFQGSCAVATVTDWNMYPFIFQTGAYPHEPFKLFMCKGLILFIRSGKMSKYSSDFNARQAGNLLNSLNGFFAGKESNTAHTGIDGNVYLQSLSQAGGFF